MNINKIREALEMAEAMADVFDQLSQKLGDLRERNADRSRLEEIREALAELDKAQPLAEPVAWMVRTRIGVEWVTTLGVTETGARQIAIERCRNGSDVQNMDPIPIYAHPPQAQQPGKVLTDEEVERVVLHICRERKVSYAGMFGEGVLTAIRYVRDNGYLAPAAGLTVEEAVQIAVDARIEIDEIAWKSPPISYEKEFRSILKRRLNEKLNTKNQ